MSRIHKLFNGQVCKKCRTSENLTRHHLKDPNGIKTGKIDILCRRCHDEAEREYERLGIVKKQEPIPMTHNEKLQLDYMNGLIPFYSLGVPSKR